MKRGQTQSSRPARSTIVRLSILQDRTFCDEICQVTAPDAPAKDRDVIGTPLCPTNYRELISHCQQMARQSGPRAIEFANTHVVTLRRHNLSFREITNCFDLFVPDGMPLIWCLNWGGAALLDRVYGPTFMRRCISQSPAPFTHYLLGGSPECVESLKRNFSSINPATQIVGSRTDYITAAEDADIIAELNRLSPDFIWVALGTPKQQEWICRNKPKLDRGILLSVGFAFDVNAGMKPDAPLWMQRCGLTWLFRVLSEPRRLGPRYAFYNFLFLFYLMRDRFFGKRSH